MHKFYWGAAALVCALAIAEPVSAATLASAIDWSPLVNAVVPAVAAIAAIVLAWLTKKVGAWLDVKREGEVVQIESALRAVVSASLENYLKAAIASKASDPVKTAAAAVVANLPDATTTLKATPEQLERKAAAILKGMVND